MRFLTICPLCFVLINAQMFYSNENIKQTDVFDFIVVGSGPSGAVLANRLTEVPEWKVLLIEAGEEASFISDFPGFAAYLQFTKYNWGYQTERDKNFCLGCLDGRMSWPHGKALGGSTVINYMIAARGNPLDYDRWAQMGSQGWSYKEILPYFKKSEDIQVKVNDPEYHGKNGYLTISDVRYRTNAGKVFVRAAQEAGYKYVDYNGRNQFGVSFAQSTTRSGFRLSAEKAFLRPVRNRKNLTILLNARVTKVLINEESKSAYGLVYIKNKKKHVVKATKEVLLSAGVFNSPQILMLSGIGPQNHLKELGIPVKQSLPVGRNLYDHIIFAGLTFTVNASLSHNLDKELGTVFEFIMKGTGPITSIGGVEALAFYKSNVSTDPAPVPDIELLFIGGSIRTDNGTGSKNLFRIPQAIYDKIIKQSVGYMKLKSKNPFHWPKFYAKYFSDPENQDIKSLIASIRESQRIINSPSMQKYAARILETPIPGCESHIFNSDIYWECAIRHVSSTLYHQIGTCKMGPANDTKSVVDPELKVIGIKNLRVVDVSIMPTPVAGHTSLPAYMIGEKAADMIKKTWGIHHET